MTPLLEARGVGVRFGGLQAVADFNFVVRGPGVYGIAGPNGSGKTTALNAITRAQAINSGSLRFGGVDYTRWPAHRVASLGISRTFQNVRLVPNLTVLQNVMVGLHSTSASASIWGSWLQLPSARREERRSRERALELLRGLEIADTAAMLPRELAYGHQRRVEIARALAGTPRLLLLDEPTAGMGRADAELVAQLVRELGHRRSIAIVIVEHNIPLLASLCDRLVVMLAGRNLTEGSPAAVLTDERVIEAYLGRSAAKKRAPE
jgi:branched-chain amino acid transport system ATP-binding protein